MSSADRRPIEIATAVRQRIAVASGVALLVAGLLLVMFVLPAEFAVDPLGIGRATGLLELGTVGEQVAALDEAAAARADGAAASARGASAITPADQPFTHETVTFALGPREGMEYKYRLGRGESLLFAWTATAPVDVEAHAEPDGAPRGYAETYEKGSRQASGAGTLVTPFAGIHGWYWANTTDAPITVTLSAAGHFRVAHEFRTGQPVRNKPFP